MMEDEKLHKLFLKHFDSNMKRHPTAATFLGYKHEIFDHLLPDGSFEAAVKETENMIAEKRELKRENDYNKLTDEGKLDYDLLEYYLDLTMFNHNELAFWKSGATAAGPVGEIGSVMYIMFSRNYAPVETRVKAMISRLKKVPKYLEETKTRWVHPVKLWTEIAIDECPRTASFFQLILQILEPQIQDDSLFQELSDVVNSASDSIVKYGEWIEKEVKPKAIHEWIIGPQKFTRLIELRKLGKTPMEILEIGEKALVDTKKQLEDLASELYPSKTVDEIRELIKSDHPPTFEMVLEHVKELTDETRQFIRNHKLMDIPQGEDLQVVPTPSFLIPIYPFAAYIQPEKFSQDQTGQYIVTPLEEREEMLKEHSYASCKNTAVHEGYPGHHLQFTSANLQPNLIRSLVQGNETIEGWAHYCEQLMAEKGFLGKKEIFIQLVDQVWRAVRIIVDIKLHFGMMTFEDAKAFMIEEIGMEESAVMAELKRYTATPGYQLSYLFGKFLLLDLRDEVIQKLGDRYTDEFFHNTILKNGGLPIHFLRRLFDLRIKSILGI